LIGRPLAVTVNAWVTKRHLENSQISCGWRWALLTWGTPAGDGSGDR